jgi:Ca2+/H+ antiporter, TMEM165/GDT1 family
MTGWTLFATVFGFIFVAELPDKTALASLVLATRHRAFPVFLGASLALTIQSVIAVAAGHLFSLLPAKAVHVGAGIVFLVSAIIMWRRRSDEGSSSKDEGAESARQGFFRSFWLVFTVVFIAEWGDLTQIATAGFEARYRSPILVFAAATAALWSVAALAVFLGNRAGRLLDARVTQRVAAVLFGLVGIVLLVSAR